MNLEMERTGAALSACLEQKEPNRDMDWGPGEELARKPVPVM